MRLRLGRDLAFWGNKRIHKSFINTLDDVRYIYNTPWQERQTMYRICKLDIKDFCKKVLSILRCNGNKNSFLLNYCFVRNCILTVISQRILIGPKSSHIIIRYIYEGHLRLIAYTYDTPAEVSRMISFFKVENITHTTD